MKNILSSTRARVRAAATAALVLWLVSVSGPAQAAIDPWPSYDPQSTCSPTAKKGTLELASYLQKHYPGSGSYGISRACSSGGRSEHKEGRAFDWRVNVTNAKERGYAYNFISRVRATDSAGHIAALARRMGIMYVIYNDTIYSSTHNFAARAYLNAGCSSKSSCSATLRHRDHMHISLTRAGGAGRTSWYGSHWVGTTTPTPTGPSDLNSEDNSVPTTSLSTPEVLNAVPGGYDRTRLAVRKGQRVKVTAYGVQRFAPGHQLVSDATCVWNDRTGGWKKTPRTAVRTRYGDPELKVNGVAVLAAVSCHGGQHVYSATIVQQATKPITVTMGGRNQHAGSVRVVLSKPSASVGSRIPAVPTAAAPPPVQAPLAGNALAVRDDVRLHSHDALTWSDEVLEAGVDYRVTVTGTRRIASGAYTDGQCLALGDRWESQGSLNLYRPGSTHGALYLDGVRFAGAAPSEDPTGCMLHTHSMDYRPSVTGRVALRIWDPTGTDDNDGSLFVRFERVTPVSAPTAAPAETPKSRGDWTRTSETFTVSADDADGRISSLRLRAGTTATIYVSGRAKVSDDRYADASCVMDGWRWVTDLGLLSGQDLFGLSIDGRAVTWKPADWSADGCDEGHRYSTKFTAQKDGPVRVIPFDLDYRDNSGSYNVTIVRG